jgi:hypothetical protein
VVGVHHVGDPAVVGRPVGGGDLVDITATSKDGSVRRLDNYRTLAYDMPRGSAAGYMPEMNDLVGWSDYSSHSDQPLMKNLKIRVTAARLATAAVRRDR